MANSKLDLHQNIDELIVELQKYIGSGTITKLYPNADTLQPTEYTLESGGYYDWKTQTHLPKVEIKISNLNK